MLAVLVLFSCGCVTNQEGFINGTTRVNGTAISPNIARYVLEVGPGRNPANWTTTGIGLTGGGTSNINQSILGSWNTSKVPDGQYTLRLTVTDSNNISSRDMVYVTVDNTPNAQTKPCPSWSCSGLAEGVNNVSISLNQTEYGSNMNCSITCTCPGNMQMGAYSKGKTEDYYDTLTLGNQELSGQWSGFYAPLNSTTTIRFTSDKSVDGSLGYTGFNVTQLSCTPYCMISSSDYYGEYISRVTLNTGSTASGGSDYSDYTAQTLTTLARGQQYVLAVQVNVSYYSGEYVKAWIDYNQDHDYTDAGEAIDLGTYEFSGTHTFTKTMTVPANALTGKTRMRITDNWLSKGPCDPIYFGEVEDYTVEITDTTTPGATTTTYGTTTTTMPSSCANPGDTPPCGQVTVGEVLTIIGQWAQGHATIGQVLNLIGLWASGG